MRLAVPALCFALSSTALAVPRVPRAQLHELAHAPAVVPLDAPSPMMARADALARLPKIAAFEAKMQDGDACAAADLGAVDGGAPPCNLGGVIEVESGAGHAIIESDNTHEAIWDWSVDEQTGGDKQYLGDSSHGFGYLASNPGWLEWQDTTDPGPDYYSVYNCGWAVRAVLEYEAATGDMSHHDYGTMCAAHLRDNALAVAKKYKNLIDQGTAAWAAAGLWLWADAAGNESDKQVAAAIGAEAKAYLDANTARPAFTTWAISGGAVFYGVVNSYMKEHPDELLPWVQKTAPLLGGWIDESMPVKTQPGEEWTDWRNAWAEWNMLAQFTAAQVLGGSDGDAHLQIALDIYSRLGAQDTDDDGGIPGSAQRPSTEDQSWITSYLAYFGIRNVLSLDTNVVDMGATPMAMAESGCAIAPRASATGMLAALALLLAFGAAVRRRKG